MVQIERIIRKSKLFGWVRALIELHSGWDKKLLCRWGDCERTLWFNESGGGKADWNWKNLKDA
jgi:hypothetical protein